MLENLFNKATLRSSSVEVAGESLQVQEPTYAQWETWRELMNSRGTEEANAFILKSCVVGDGGEKLTDEDAARLARCPTRILAPIIGTILGISIEPKAKAKNV